jgi:hypothetical protein
LKKIFIKHEFDVESFFDNKPPYIFVHCYEDNATFGGVRIYIYKNNIAYRMQNKPDSEPYGYAYLINLDEIYAELLFHQKDYDKNKLSKEVALKMISAIEDFFKENGEAQEDMETAMFNNDGDPMGKVIIKTMGTDYSSKIHNNNGF